MDIVGDLQQLAAMDFAGVKKWKKVHDALVNEGYTVLYVLCGYSWDYNVVIDDRLPAGCRRLTWRQVVEQIKQDYPNKEPTLRMGFHGGLLYYGASVHNPNQAPIIVV